MSRRITAPASNLCQPLSSVATFVLPVSARRRVYIYGEERLLIDNDSRLDDVSTRSVILHELVHFLQDRVGEAGDRSCEATLLRDASLSGRRNSICAEAGSTRGSRTICSFTAAKTLPRRPTQTQTRRNYRVAFCRFGFSCGHRTSRATAVTKVASNRMAVAAIKRSTESLCTARNCAPSITIEPSSGSSRRPAANDSARQSGGEGRRMRLFAYSSAHSQNAIALTTTSSLFHAA
jgi:hypothetical protein